MAGSKEGVPSIFSADFWKGIPSVFGAIGNSINQILKNGFGTPR